MKALRLLFLSTILAIPVFVNAQTSEQIANQRLGKAMDYIDAQDKVIAAQNEASAAKDETLAAYKQQILLLQQLVESQKVGLKVRDDQIADLSKLKANKVRFFWGLISITRNK